MLRWPRHRPSRLSEHRMVELADAGGERAGGCGVGECDCGVVQWQARGQVVAAAAATYALHVADVGVEDAARWRQ